MHSTEYFFDGGFLLHLVIWTQNTTFGKIYIQIRRYISHHYWQDCCVIFDGYSSDELSTKVLEQERRAGSVFCPDILFDDTWVPSVSQSKFLTNSKNKANFIKSLSLTLTSCGHRIVQPKGDADTDIVFTALQRAKESHEDVVVVSEDAHTVVTEQFEFHQIEK